MIYVTGDLHGDLQRFKEKAIRRLGRGDFLLCCGDFGFVWDGSAAEEKVLSWIGKRRFTTLFVDGCHDNLDLLARYPQEERWGGRVRPISGRLFHLCRGTVVHLDGISVFALGGGVTPSLDGLVPGLSWWPEELPSQEELDAAWEAYRRAGGAQVILTHDCPSSLLGCMAGEGTPNRLQLFLERLRREGGFDRWYFGRYHQDRQIPPVYHALYQQVLPFSPALPRR